MIIQVRGTSGSGKSTLVRQVTERCTLLHQQRRPDRRQPLGYVYELAPPKAPSDTPLSYLSGTKETLYIPGHYETPCGGCDTISDGFDYIFNLVQEAARARHHVLFEGMLLNSDVRRVIELSQEGWVDVLVVDLSTPIERCIEDINARRRAKNPDAKPVSEKNTRARHAMCQRARQKLVDAGVEVHHVSREDGLDIVLSVLGLT